MWILENLNKLATDFLPLIQLLMLLAVSAATITALLSTWRAGQDRRVLVDYECEISSIMKPHAITAENTAHYEHSHKSVTATLTNVGLRPTSIPWIAFGMSIPRAKMAALLQPSTDYRATAPLSLNPGERRTLELRSPEQLREEILGIELRWLPRVRIRRLRLTFATESGDVFRAKIGKVLRTYINETAAQKNWIYQRQQKP